MFLGTSRLSYCRWFSIKFSCLVSRAPSEVGLLRLCRNAAPLSWRRRAWNSRFSSFNRSKWSSGNCRLVTPGCPLLLLRCLDCSSCRRLWAGLDFSADRRDLDSPPPPPSLWLFEVRRYSPPPWGCELLLDSFTSPLVTVGNLRDSLVLLVICWILRDSFISPLGSHLDSVVLLVILGILRDSVSSPLVMWCNFLKLLAPPASLAVLRDSPLVMLGSRLSWSLVTLESLLVSTIPLVMVGVFTTLDIRLDSPPPLDPWWAFLDVDGCSLSISEWTDRQLGLSLRCFLSVSRDSWCAECPPPRDPLLFSSSCLLRSVCRLVVLRLFVCTIGRSIGMLMVFGGVIMPVVWCWLLGRIWYSPGEINVIYEAIS